jgi:hypothetical protein
MQPTDLFPIIEGAGKGIEALIDLLRDKKPKQPKSPEEIKREALQKALEEEMLRNQPKYPERNDP